jgi:hypothetical protein
VRFTPAAAPTSDETGTLRFDLQPLFCQAMSGAAPECPRTPVGASFGPFETPVDAEGGFEIDLGSLLLPGEANPITGRALEGHFTLVGSLGGRAICGRVSGEVTAPVQAPLQAEQNTFGSVRLGEFGVSPDYPSAAIVAGCVAEE